MRHIRCRMPGAAQASGRVVVANAGVEGSRVAAAGRSRCLHLVAVGAAASCTSLLVVATLKSGEVGFWTSSDGGKPHTYVLDATVEPRGAAAAASAWPATLFSFDRAVWPMQIGLTLDLVSSSTSCGHTNIVLKPGSGGEPDAARTIFYGSVLDTLAAAGPVSAEEGRSQHSGSQRRLFMFYVGLPAGVADGRGGHVCLATSDDGESWEKPQLGSRRNVVLADEDDVGAVLALFDPQDPDPERRFKLLIKVRPYHLAIAFSPDGLTWPARAERLHGLAGVDPSGIARWRGGFRLAGHRDRSHGRRKLHVFASSDFRRWTEASGLFARGAESSPAAQDHNAGEQVHLGAALWARWPSLLGVYGQWHGHPSNDRSLVSIDLGLLVSSDGFNFAEPSPGFRFVEAAEDGCSAAWGGDFPSRTPALAQGQAFANVGSRTLFWYGAWPEQRATGVRLATWARDRLGSWRCSRCGSCHAISSALSLASAATEVLVNVAGLEPKLAELHVELLDKHLHPLPGFSGPEAAVVASSGFSVQVRFPRTSFLSVRGEVRFRVSFQGAACEQAKLFAVYTTLLEPDYET